MAVLPDTVSQLIVELGKLPGIGPRSAERIALHLVQTTGDEATRLAQVIVQAHERTVLCEVCGGLSEISPCALCGDDRRDPSLLCVVERPVDILHLEKSGAFRGKYHVLGGKISPLNGVQPEDLRFDALEQRLAREPIREVVIALGTDVEGDATGFYLAKRVARPELKVTRLAYGLPAGTGLEFADELTLGRALDGRRELE
jgi:recombination protein RecR